MALVLTVMSLNTETEHLFQKHTSHSSFPSVKYPLAASAHLSFCLLISRSLLKKVYPQYKTR